ncbi:GntR family transcriptional regulator [Nonomuraea sp. 3-1Str]|uniref:GntR family transcriptional regulator n=1 Tax=Nonomuraea sp. 3-1Str TaxID=2929801 RepID=UPI0028679EBF|nr:GntR family transcriptional regulator [Nonomuraea sp. 3-1Str]MDR8415060.1 GntR family transcriptional regulator [Nonomuraea sp. 3-1Str]
MAPTLNRPDPPYLQIVSHFRQKIMSGELREGDRLPTGRQISEDFSVAIATATKVITTLRSEGLVDTAPGRGTIVKPASHSPTDRAIATRRTGRIYPPDEHAKIKTAALVDANERIADALGLQPGAPVVRRQRVTYRGDQPVSASTSWFDGQLAEVAPRLLETERILQGTFGYLAEVTGRTIKTVRDQNAADAASEQDIQDLGVPLGSPVLRGRNWVYDGDGNIIEYGEYVSAAQRWQSYEFEITDN